MGEITGATAFKQLCCSFGAPTLQNTTGNFLRTESRGLQAQLSCTPAAQRPQPSVGDQREPRVPLPQRLLATHSCTASAAKWTLFQTDLHPNHFHFQMKNHFKMFPAKMLWVPFLGSDGAFELEFACSFCEWVGYLWVLSGFSPGSSGSSCHSHKGMHVR